MVKFKETTIFCIYTILSYTLNVCSATDGGFTLYDTAFEKRPVRVVAGPVKQYFEDQLSLPNPTPGTKLPSFYPLHNVNVPSAKWQRVYRNELLRLILKAKGDVETNLAYIKNIALKNPNGTKVILRMGDLVKFVESRYNKLVQLYSKLRSNRDALHLPKLVHVYEAILRGKHEIATILGIIHSKEPEWSPLYTPSADDLMDRFESSIAWSYYDDNW